jgi:hypothetical protein
MAHRRRALHGRHSHAGERGRPLQERVRRVVVARASAPGHKRPDVRDDARQRLGHVEVGHLV